VTRIFQRPVLNTFLRFGDHEVARIIFHELAHQLVYADGDSAFNESFATAVENEGMRRWLARTASPERLGLFETQQERKAQFHRLVADTSIKLRTIYVSSLAPDAKRYAKMEALAEMKRAYADLKAGWGGYGGYDQWFNRPLNNAILGSVTLYTQWVPAFRACWSRKEGSGAYQRVALAQLPKAERSALNQLLSSRIASAVSDLKHDKNLCLP
jgi:predicted aminopeptidase